MVQFGGGSVPLMRPLGLDQAGQAAPDLHIVFGMLGSTVTGGSALHGGVQWGSAAVVYVLLVMVRTSSAVAANCRGSRSSCRDVEGAGSNCEARPPATVCGSADGDCFCSVSAEV